MKLSATAAADLCSWVRAMNLYYDVAKRIAPQKEQVKKMQEQLAVANEKLKKKQGELQVVKETVQKLKLEGDIMVKAK